MLYASAQNVASGRSLTLSPPSLPLAAYVFQALDGLLLLLTEQEDRRGLTGEHPLDPVPHQTSPSVCLSVSALLFCSRYSSALTLHSLHIPPRKLQQPADSLVSCLSPLPLLPPLSLLILPSLLQLNPSIQLCSHHRSAFVHSLINLWLAFTSLSDLYNSQPGASLHSQRSCSRRPLCSPPPPKSLVS